VTWPPPGVAAGAAVPPLQRAIELPDMIAYAGATWDWHRLHYDAAYAAERGLPGPLVDGQVLGALLAETVQDWLGPQAFLRRLAFRFARPVVAGQVVRCEGTVRDVADGAVTCDLRVVVVGDGGEVASVAVQPAEAEAVRRT